MWIGEISLYHVGGRLLSRFLVFLDIHDDRDEETRDRDDHAEDAPCPKPETRAQPGRKRTRDQQAERGDRGRSTRDQGSDASLHVRSDEGLYQCAQGSVCHGQDESDQSRSCEGEEEEVGWRKSDQHHGNAETDDPQQTCDDLFTEATPNAQKNSTCNNSNPG